MKADSQVVCVFFAVILLAVSPSKLVYNTNWLLEPQGETYKYRYEDLQALYEI